MAPGGSGATVSIRINDDFVYLEIDGKILATTRSRAPPWPPIFLGSVKWLESAQFDDHDLVKLQRHRDRVTSEPVPMIAVSRSGTATAWVDAAFSPDELLGRGGLTPTSPGRPRTRSASVKSAARPVTV